MRNTSSTYYIGTGQKNGFYTLRHQYTIEVSTETGKALFDYDEYVCTLSTDRKKAVEKAEKMGHTVSLPEFTLEEITRRNAALCAEEREKAVAIEREIQRKAKFELEKFYKKRLWPVGKHRGEKYDVADNDYIMFFGGGDDRLALALREDFPNLFPRTNTRYFGEPKKKYEEKVLCTSSFGFDGNYGWTNIIVLVTKSGHQLTYIGSGSFHASVGEEFTATFKVKEHGTYKGENQNKIFYVKKK